jgi:hypothetical protein
MSLMGWRLRGDQLKPTLLSGPATFSAKLKISVYSAYSAVNKKT